MVVNNANNSSSGFFERCKKFVFFKLGERVRKPDQGKFTQAFTNIQSDRVAVENETNTVKIFDEANSPTTSNRDPAINQTLAKWREAVNSDGEIVRNDVILAQC